MKRFQRASAFALALASFAALGATLSSRSPVFAASPFDADSPGLAADAPSPRTSVAAPKYGQTYYLAPPATTYYYAYPTYVAAPTYVYPTPIGPPIQVWLP